MKYLAPFILILIFFSFVFVSVNSLGLLFGFEKQSDVCWNYSNNISTNFQHYFVIVAPYACKPDGGLFQPYVKNTFNWLGETHK